MGHGTIDWVTSAPTLADYEHRLVDVMEPETESEYYDVLHIAKITWDQRHNFRLCFEQTDVSEYEHEILKWTEFEMRANQLRFIDPELDRQHCEALPRLLK